MPETSRLTCRRGFRGLGAAILVASGLIPVGLGCSRSTPAPVAGATSDLTPLHPVLVHKPAGSPTIHSGTFDEKGQPVSIACATCHVTRPPVAGAKIGTPLALFHQGLIGKHGELSCHACHNPGDGYASLRLADGKTLPYTEVMTLCSQCHGPQYRDYLHGAHGGMIGHWDLKKGGRERNNCIECHDPHAPKYPVVTPARGPSDRFQSGGHHE